MKVTVCQIDSREGKLDQYLSELQNHIETHGTDFLLLPEMGLSDWLAADQNDDAKKWEKAVQDQESRIAQLGNLGAKAVMGTRPIVNATGSRRNQAYVWTQDAPEPAGFHDKYYLPDEEGYWEHTWYDRGPKSFEIARALDMRLGVQICTEMWFFEWARHYAASRADLLCIPRVTPHGSVDKWLAGGQAAAVCSGSFCLSSNLWAPKGESPNTGGLGWVIDPEGNILATTDENAPFATVEIDLAYAQKSKSTYPRYVPE